MSYPNDVSVQDYIAKAVETEGVVQHPLNVPNIRVFFNAIQALEFASNILDAYKKNIFYKKELDLERITENVEALKNLHFGPGLDAALIESINPRTLHGLLGILTESGELASLLGSYATGNQLDVPNLKEELGDMTWYGRLLLDSEGLDLVKNVLDPNYEKLAKKRYKGGFSNEKAIDRNIEEEQKTFE